MTKRIDREDRRGKSERKRDKGVNNPTSPYYRMCVFSVARGTVTRRKGMNR